MSALCNSRIRPLANDFVTVCEFPPAGNVVCYTPDLFVLMTALIATMDLVGSGQPSFEPQGRIFISMIMACSGAKKAHSRLFMPDLS